MQVEILFPPHDAVTLVLLSRKNLSSKISFIASSISSIVISAKIPLLPPTLIVKIGVSFSKFLKTRSVVPSPPNVTTRSNLTFLISSSVSICFAPSTITGEIVYTVAFVASNFFVTSLAAFSESLNCIYIKMIFLRTSVKTIKYESHVIQS